MPFGLVVERDWQRRCARRGWPGQSIMVIGLSREPFLTVAELIAMDVCVGTIVPYLNCLLTRLLILGEVRRSIELFSLSHLVLLGI